MRRRSPKTPEEAAERWRQRVKFDLLKETADKVAMDEAVKKLTKRYNSIRKSWQQTDNDELLERYLSAMTTGFDPHSSYMAPVDARQLQHPDEARAGRHRRFAPRRRRLHGRSKHHPRRRRRQERRPQAGGQDRRRRRRRQRPDGRHRRHEAQRRREEDPRQARHDRAAGSRPERRRRAARRSPSRATASS